MNRAEERPPPPPAPPGAPPRLRIEVTTRTLVIALVVVASAWLVVKLWAVLLVIVVSLILVGTLDPLVDLLVARRVPRTLAVLLAFLAMLVVCGALVAATVPPFLKQLPSLVERAPAISASVAAWLAHHRLTAPLAVWFGHAATSEQVGKATVAVITWSPHLLELVGYAVTVLFLSLYLMIDRDRVRGAFFAVVPRDYHVRLARVLLNFERIVGGYVRGQLFTSVLMGSFVFVLLSILHVPSALPIAVFGGLADVLPYIGVVLTMAPAVLAALSVGTGTAIIVFVALGIYEEIEGRIIIPRVYGRVLRLPSAIVIVALLAGGTLMGILGALLALPIAAGIRMIVEQLRVELPGEDLDTTRVRARDAVVEQRYIARTRGAPAEEAAGVATEIAEASRRAEGETGPDAEPRPITTEQVARKPQKSRLRSRATSSRRTRSAR